MPDWMKEFLRGVAVIYLAIGVLNNFFGPRLSTDESICVLAKGGGIHDSFVRRTLMWPADQFGPLPPSCLYRGLPAQMSEVRLGDYL